LGDARRRFLGSGLVRRRDWNEVLSRKPRGSDALARESGGGAGEWREGRKAKESEMTKLLEKAIDRNRSLPEAEQDAMAKLILDAIEAGAHPAALDEATIAALEEGLAQARRGEFASANEVAALWKRHGL
jgi:predicted transcriptional regulator